jgi:hypothetical protein
MPKTTEQLAASKAGETAETNGFGSQERPLRRSGVYELKNEEGKVVDSIIVKTHPKFGDSQAAAVERVGYKYARPVEEGEVKTIEVDATQLATENKDGSVTQDDLKGLQARLNALEKENADLKAGQRAESEGGAADGAVKAQAKEEAKDEAQSQLEQRGQADPLGNAPQGGSEEEDEDEDEGDAEKPLNRQNRAELEATAEREGVELTEAEDTNAKIAEKIQKARDEKEGK